MKQPAAQAPPEQMRPLPHCLPAATSVQPVVEVDGSQLWQGLPCGVSAGGTIVLGPPSATVIAHAAMQLPVEQIVPVPQPAPSGSVLQPTVELLGVQTWHGFLGSGLPAGNSSPAMRQSPAGIPLSGFPPSSVPESGTPESALPELLPLLPLVPVLPDVLPLPLPLVDPPLLVAPLVPLPAWTQRLLVESQLQPDGHGWESLQLLPVGSMKTAEGSHAARPSASPATPAIARAVFRMVLRVRRLRRQGRASGSPQGRQTEKKASR